VDTRLLYVNLAADIDALTTVGDDIQLITKSRQSLASPCYRVAMVLDCEGTHEYESPGMCQEW
jgi:hypothetical protein